MAEEWRTFLGSKMWQSPSSWDDIEASDEPETPTRLKKSRRTTLASILATRHDAAPALSPASVSNTSPPSSRGSAVARKLKLGGTDCEK